MQANPSNKAIFVRNLVHNARDASLGTLTDHGSPHVSHVSAATLCDGAPLLLLSELAVHTANLRRDSRASLLFVAAEGESADTNTRARVTLVGTVAPAPDRAEARARMLRRHPDAALYADFADFHFMRFAPASAHLVAGFGRISDVEAQDLLADPEAAAAMAAIDEGACEHLDEDHRDAMALIATRLCGAPDGPWRAAGIDPLGIDLIDGAVGVRAEFDKPVSSSGELRAALKRMSDAARHRAAS